MNERTQSANLDAVERDSEVNFHPSAFDTIAITVTCHVSLTANYALPEWVNMSANIGKRHSFTNTP